jgi:hypothetical protein
MGLLGDAVDNIDDVASSLWETNQKVDTADGLTRVPDWRDRCRLRSRIISFSDYAAGILL